MLFILLFISLFTAAVGKYNVFENQTIELKFNELAFFETPDFPMLHNATKFLNYNVTFFTKDESVNGTRCLMYLQGLAYKPTPFKGINDVYVFEISSFYLETYHYALQFYDAFSGFLYFDEIDDSCVFEKMAKDIPYKFADENEVIYIASVYKNLTNFIGTSVTPNRTNSCKWQFIAPEGYGIKIYIQDFNLLSNTSFRMSNSSPDFLLTERSTKSNRPYYFNDLYQYFKIELSKAGHYFATEVEFSAYISVVQKNDTKIDGKCVINATQNGFTWASAYNLTQGYLNNIYCNYEVKVKAGTTVLGVVQQYSLENNVDHLIYHDEMYSYELNLHNEFVLRPHLNGSQKSYFFEFVTDGNVQASGFLIDFIENACECADSIILCDSRTYTVMRGSSYVCTDINCVFTIESCNSSYTSLFIYSANYTKDDLIKVVSNGTVVYNSIAVSLGPSGNQTVYLDSLSDNIMEINSISNGPKNTTFTLAPFELPTIDERIILTENGTNFILDASATSYAVVEIQKALWTQNVALVVYGRNNLECKNGFFSNKSLTEMEFFDKCPISTYYYKCISKVKKMTYFNTDVVNNCFIAFSITSHEKNCVFPTTVYFVEGDLSVVSALSTTEGVCKISILKEFDKSYMLADVFTTALDANVEIWFGTNQKTKFFEFNKHTSARWRNTKMLSEVYAAIIPKGAVLQLTFVSIKLPLYEIVQGPYYSMVATPHFGMKRCWYYDTEAFISFFIGDIKATVTIMEMNTNSDAYFQTNGKKISVKKMGDFVTFKNQNVSFHFGNTAQDFCGCMMFISAFKTEVIKYATP